MVAWRRVTCLCHKWLLLLVLLRFASVHSQYHRAAAGSSLGVCPAVRSPSAPPTCTFVLFCVLSGGQATGPCGGNVLYTCCSPRVITIRQTGPVSRRTPPAASNNYYSSYAKQHYATTTTTAAPYPPPNFNQRMGYIVESCGKIKSKPQSRIVGGQDAYYGEFPWQAHIKINRQQCGGALVSAYFVVTAAHCVYKADLNEVTVLLGAWDIQDQSRQLYPAYYFRVVEKKVHPYFRFSPSHPDRYDVALLRLDRAVHFRDTMLPVCLPQYLKNFQGWRALVTGWGKTDPGLSNRYGTRLLQKVDVPIIANEDCESWHRTRGIDLKIFPEMMCAGYEVGLKDACVGDSGGPLVTYVEGRWTLVGITSAGFGCAQSKQPGIYHRVSLTVDWIYANIY